MLSAGVAVKPSGQAVSEQLPSDRRPLGGGRSGVPEDPAGTSGGQTTASSQGGEQVAMQQVSLCLDLNTKTETKSFKASFKTRRKDSNDGEDFQLHMSLLFPVQSHLREITAEISSS